MGAGIFAFFVVLAANTLRVTSLFYMESGLIELPPAAHSWIGMASQLIAARHHVVDCAC